jgi:hypothetical protein
VRGLQRRVHTRESAVLLSADHHRLRQTRRAGHPTRITLAALSSLIEWRRILTIVKPDTLIAWHRKGLRLFWRRKSKPRGRPRLPAELRELIAEVATANRRPRTDYRATRPAHTHSEAARTEPAVAVREVDSSPLWFLKTADAQYAIICHAPTGFSVGTVSTTKVLSSSLRRSNNWSLVHVSKKV